LKRAFMCAFQGIIEVLRKERNFRIMLVCLVIVLAAGFFCKLSNIEWAAVLICCGGVLSLELANTALEAVVNLVTGEYRELARKAKDTAAGASLVFAAFSAVTGLVIFIPHILMSFKIK